MTGMSPVPGGHQHNGWLVGFCILFMTSLSVLAGDRRNISLKDPVIRKFDRTVWHCMVNRQIKDSHFYGQLRQLYPGNTL